MWIIEIAANPNGSHNDLNSDNITDVPEGWAVVGCPMTNFPFGTPKIEVVNGIATVTEWKAGTVPVPTKPEKIPTMAERVEALEEAVALTDEIAIELFEAQVVQEEINAAQDDALIELYELIGG